TGRACRHFQFRPAGAGSGAVATAPCVCCPPRRGVPLRPGSGQPRGPTASGTCPRASALERIHLADVDGAAGTEQRHQDRQADRRLRGRDRQDEEHEQLASRITQLAREGDEVDVDRKQHQLDRHQQDDDVLAVEEDAREADAEQHRAQRQHVSKGDHAWPSPSAFGASGAGFSAGMETMRRRSAALTRDCSAAFWVLMPVRLRRVIITAAITATVRITAANSNGRMYCVNSVSASQRVLEVSAASAAALSAGNGVALRDLTPISVSTCTSITTATTRPTGRNLTQPSRIAATSMSSIITTNRNSTITAPTYTRTRATPRNSAPTSSQVQATEKKVRIRHSTALTGLRTLIKAQAEATATAAKA